MSRCGADLVALAAQRDRLRRISFEVSTAGRRIGHRALAVASASGAHCGGMLGSLARDLAELADSIDAQIGRLESADVATVHSGRLSELVASKVDEARRSLAAHMMSLDAAGSTEELDSLLSPERQILRYESEGEGKVVELFGDLSTVTSLAVVVGGMGSSVSNFDVKTSRRGRNLFEAVGGEGTAVIAWNGYDAPDELTADVLSWFEVATPGSAQKGADELEHLLDELCLPRGIRVTLLGHSYGSLVVAEVASRRSDIDDVIVMGSPGVGDLDTSELARSTRLWTMAADNDPIDDLGWFGGDPNDPGTGWTKIDIGDDSGHGSYLTEGSASLEQAALVVAGRSDELEIDEPGWLDRFGDRFDDVDDLIDLWRFFAM